LIGNKCYYCGGAVIHEYDELRADIGVCLNCGRLASEWQCAEKPSELACKICGSLRLYRYGRNKGVQIYFCRDCNHKFKGDNSAFHGKTDFGVILEGLNAYRQGARILVLKNGRRIRRATLWRWQRKYNQDGTLIKSPAN
jgi:transposase-like protein